MKSLVEMVKYEFLLDLKEKWQYKTGLFSDLLIFTAMYLMIYFWGLSGEFSSYYGIDEKSGMFLVLVGYFSWQINAMSLGYISSAIKNEAANGTLEIAVQSRYSLVLLYYVKMIANLIFILLVFSGVILVFAVTSHLGIKDLLFLSVIIIMSIPSICGMYGIGLVIGGISLKEKNIGQFVMIIQTLLLFVSNALSPTRGNAAKLLPFTEGISIVRQLYMGQMVSVQEYLVYLGINLFWLGLGIGVFALFLERERRVGSFENY